MATEMRDVDIWMYDFLQERSMHIQQAKDLRIEKFLQGSEQLSFRLPLADPKLDFLHEDQLIEAEGMFWVVDHFEDTHPGDKTIICNARWIELSWRVRLGPFSILAKTPEDGLTQILTGSGWTVADAPASSDLYTMEEMDGTNLSLLRRWATVTGYELSFDTVNKTVSMVTQVGQERPLGFRWAQNIREIGRKFYPPPATRLYPVGANNLTISDVNPTGQPYIEDYSFYTAQGLSLIQARALYRKDLIWVDQRYLLAVNLYDAAVARMAKLSQPRVFYSAKVIDLSRVIGGDASGYEPGDTTTVDDEIIGVLEDVRVTRVVRFPNDPKRDEVELGFLTNGLLDVSDGGNRELDYSDIFMIVDVNEDELVIASTTQNYGEIALTSAGSASVVAGSTFVGTASGTGTIEWRMVVDGVVQGKAYSSAFTDGALVEFSWPSLATDIPEGAHEIHWRAQVISGTGTVTLEANHGRSWVLTRGAVGVGVNTSPNAFVSEGLETFVASLVDEFVVEFVEVVPVTVDHAESIAIDALELEDIFALPWQLEDALFGEIDSIYDISGPYDPAALGFTPYHPPPGGSAGGSEDIGGIYPGPPPTLLEAVAWSHAYWAEGPLMSLLGYANTDPVTVWPDEIGGVDLVTGTAPVYVAADAALNNRPVVDFVTTDYLVQEATTAAMNGVVVIGYMKAIGGNRWHDVQGAGGGGRWVMGTYTGNVWQVYYGSAAGQTVASDLDPHLFTYYQSGSSDRMDVDDVTIYGPSDYGSSVMTKLDINDTGTGGGVVLAFLGEYAGDPTTDPGWEDFKAQVADLYGIAF